MDGPSFRIDMLAGVLDAASVRHRVIAHNLANVNTPQFQRLTVAFEDDLKQALTRGGDVRSVRPQVAEAVDGTTRPDGNNVDIDQEMAQLTQNNLLYAATAQILSSRLAMLRSAISGR